MDAISIRMYIVTSIYILLYYVVVVVTCFLFLFFVCSSAIGNFRIQFKILMITSKAIHGMAPSYLSNLICIRSSSRYSLRNNDTIFLERPKGVEKSLKTYLFKQVF